MVGLVVTSAIAGLADNDSAIARASQRPFRIAASCPWLPAGPSGSIPAGPLEVRPDLVLGESTTVHSGCPAVRWPS
jgi:hypothetical protein